jgi:hypothetical protein
VSLDSNAVETSVRRRRPEDVRCNSNQSCLYFNMYLLAPRWSMLRAAADQPQAPRTKVTTRRSRSVPNTTWWISNHDHSPATIRKSRNSIVRTLVLGTMSINHKLHCRIHV